MDAYMRTWLLFAVLIVTACLIASQKVDKGMAGPEDQEEGMAGPEDQVEGMVGPEDQEEYSGSGQSTCRNDTCNQNGLCTIKRHGDKSVAVCECDHGVVGRWCNDISKRTYATYCSPDPCKNGGSCDVNGYGTDFVCYCLSGFSGRTCIENGCSACQPEEVCKIIRGVPMCLPSHHCMPTTTCIHGNCVSSSKCQCDLGWIGNRCDRGSYACHPNPCFNNGACSVDGDQLQCDCDPHFSGSRCETIRVVPAIPCPPGNPCQNGGVCYRAGRMMQCHCSHGYTGVFCTVPALQSYPCSSNPCQNGGACRLYENAYTCACLPGTTGGNCQRREKSEDSPCNPNPCKGGCECATSCRHANGYYCTGTNGLLGKNCQIPAPVIVCGANAISVSIDAEVVNEYDPGFGEFKMFMGQSHSMTYEHACPAQELGNSYSLVLPLPFNNCGSKVVTNDDGKTIVSNYIWLNRWIANGIGDMPVPILHFTCEYETQYSVISSLTPGVGIPPTIVFRGARTVSAMIDLCKSGEFCPSQCPEMYSLSQGATYTVGEDLFLRITPTRTGTRFRISDLFLSCSFDPATTFATSPVVLLANGCLATGSRKYLPTNVRPTSAGICTSFPVPLLKSCAKFYIHAKLQPCAPGFCVAAHTSCLGRRKRSDETSGESDEKPRIQVYGPIVVIKGKEGVATKVMYPGEEYLNSTNTGVLILKDEAMPTITGSSIIVLPLYVALGVLLVVAVIVFGLLVGHNWHYINAHCGRRV